MKKMGKGRINLSQAFILMEVLAGLFLLGLLGLIGLSILTSSYSHFNRIRLLTEMNYLAESVYERMSSQDPYCKELLDELSYRDELIYLDLDGEVLDKYEVRILKVREEDKLMEVSIIIKYLDGEGEGLDVEFKGSILKEEGLYHY